MKTKKLAKMAVALKTCEILHKAGETLSLFHVEILWHVVENLPFF